MELNGKTALVTGATGGLGGAIASALARAGAAVVASGRRPDDLARVGDETGGRVVVADLSTTAGVEALVRQVGPVDVLVANAGLPASGPLLDYEPEQIERAVAVNLVAPVLLTRALLPGMLERREGQIVLMSSLSGLAGTPETSLYNATKFGLRGFGLGLREDLYGTGVGLTVVAPGFVRGAGMFVESGFSQGGGKLPAGVGTSSLDDVTAAVLRAVAANPPEILVASRSMRFGTRFASLFPEPAAWVARRLGSNRVAAEVAAGQRRFR
jgi:short-subunit dehydrogenase